MPDTGTNYDDRAIVNYVGQYYGRLEDNNENEKNFNLNLNTGTFLSQINSLIGHTYVLKNMFINLWKNYKYLQEYNAFLLGSTSEDDFLNIANEYAVETADSVNSEELSAACNILFSYFDEKITSSEISMLLNVEVPIIESEIEQIDSCKITY